uniref:(California timema) hypothetical protein n=1 Tax=Timema californicum TaxID=61474 RepID=A0A7R9JCW1_TIMCA|nr:unnamed protein product [Timema californicum]
MGVWDVVGMFGRFLGREFLGEHYALIPEFLSDHPRRETALSLSQTTGQLEFQALTILCGPRQDTSERSQKTIPLEEEILKDDPEHGIILNNMTLQLKNVSKKDSGNYSCAKEDWESSPYDLDVLYLPACSPDQPRVIRAAKNETVNITCEVDSNPPEVMFQWMFNNSATTLDIHPSHFFQLGTVSLIVYTPLADLDYGTFQCLAYNRVGRQREPCVVDLVPEDASETDVLGMTTSSDEVPDTTVLLASQSDVLGLTTSSDEVPDTAVLLASQSDVLGLTTSSDEVPDTTVLLASQSDEVPDTTVLLASQSDVLGLTSSSDEVPDTAVLLASQSDVLASQSDVLGLTTSSEVPDSTVLLASQSDVLGLTTSSEVPDTTVLASQSDEVPDTTVLLASQSVCPCMNSGSSLTGLYMSAMNKYRSGSSLDSLSPSWSSFSPLSSRQKYSLLDAVSWTHPSPPSWVDRLNVDVARSC